MFASGLVSTLFACGGGGSGGGNPQDGNPNPTPGPVAGSYRETGRWLTGNRPNGIDVGADATVVVAMRAISSRITALAAACSGDFPQAKGPWL